MNKYEFFDEGSCIECGICFRDCPVLKLPVKEAQKEIKRLIDGQETEYVSKKCVSCGYCNLLCPFDCLPSELILQRRYEKYKKIGLPSIYSFVATPLQPSPNLWTIMRERLPEDEKKTIQSWSKLSKSEEVLNPGCVVRSFFPYLTYSKLLQGLTIMMKDELCCGVFLYMTGLFDQAQQVAKRLEKQFKIMGIKRMIFLCDACYYAFKELYPKRFGIKFEFEPITLRDWLWERIESGKIEVKHRLNRKVTIQDGCHARLYGADHYDLTRKLLERLGAQIVEMEHSKENSLCCGIGPFVATQDITELMDTCTGTYKEAEETGADALVVNCTSCLWMLSMGKSISSGKMPIYHVLEMVQKAIGEEPVHRNMERAEEIFRIAMEEAPKYLSELPDKYWMKQIAPE